MSNEDVRSACAAVAEAMGNLVAAVQNNGQAARFAPNDPARERPAPPIGSALTAPDESAPISEPTSNRIYVYLAGCRGLADLARRHGLEIMQSLNLRGAPYIAKIGTTTVPLEVRLQQIGADRYGAAVYRGGQLVIEPGFEHWVAQTILTSRPPRDPAVTLLPRAIAVDLPAGLSRRSFDKGLQKALARRALDQLPASVVPARHAAYDLVQTRVSAARELYALSPVVAGDCDLMLGAVEMILDRHRSKDRSKDPSPARPAIPAKSRSDSGRRSRMQQAAALAVGADHQLAADLGTRVRLFPYRNHRATRS